MHTHVSVKHTPLATVLIFNKFLILKKITPPLEGACRSLYHDNES